MEEGAKVSPRSREIALQEICAGITLIITIFLSLSIYRLSIVDPTPAVNYLLPKDISINTPPIEVEVGLSIFDFTTFDPIKNEFIFDGTIWFKFNPTEITLETIGNFSFVKGTILQKSAPELRMVNNQLIAAYDVKVQCSTNLDYRQFPFEDHRVFIVVTNTTISAAEFMYICHRINFTTRKEIMALGEWRIIDRATDYGYSGELKSPQGNAHAIALFSIAVKREGFGTIFTLVMPLFILFMLSVFMLSYDKIVESSLTIIGALITYRFVIDLIIPKVGYFTIIDYVYLLSITVSTYVLLLGLVIAWAKHHLRKVRLIKTISIPFLYSTWILLWIYLAYGL